MKGFPGGSIVKSLPAMPEMQVQSFGQEDSPEKEMATYLSILAWEIPRTEELAGCSPWSHRRDEENLVIKQQQTNEGHIFQRNTWGETHKNDNL